MFSGTLAILTAHPHMLCSYRVIMGITALLCLMEIIRVTLMMRIMAIEKVRDKEPIIYNCMLMAIILLGILAGRCILTALNVDRIYQVSVYDTLQILPIIVLIYLLRIAGKFVWLEDICMRYNLPCARKARKRETQ